MNFNCLCLSSHHCHWSVCTSEPLLLFLALFYVFEGKNELLKSPHKFCPVTFIFKQNKGFSNGAISLLSSSTQTVNLAFLRWPINDRPKHDHFSHQLLNYSSQGTLRGGCGSSCQASTAEPAALWESSGNGKIPPERGSGIRQRCEAEGKDPDRNLQLQSLTPPL